MTSEHDVDIRWTTHGVPHIRSATWGGLGYGQGWACARDHLPTIADQIVKVRSERALFHGEGPSGVHLASDLGYLALGVAERASWLRDQQPPSIREVVSGYTAGYNARVDEAHREGSLPDWCAGAPWIRRIDELDLYAYLGDIALMASGRNLAALIGWARPPGESGPHPPAPIEALGGAPPASNGWALGGDVTRSGGGMVLANPHFPWGGEARFWECHLTVPGDYDVYGVSLLGAPGIQMGFNDGLAWAHTFSKGHRFTLYRLKLVHGAPTEYRYADGTREMTSTTQRVQVLEDGEVRTVERELWSTHHGPMLNMPLLGWGQEIAFSYRDANVDNAAVLGQFFAMGAATDLDGFRAAFRQVKGMPWVNTLAADRHGTAYYGDHSATPALSDAATKRFLQRLDDDLIAALMHQNRIALLEGDEPDDEWVERPEARSPGLEPPDRLPELVVRDVVVNANDSHWQSHPTRTLEDFPVLCGLERTPRSLRTRQNLRLARALAERGDAELADVLGAVFDNASLSAELLRDQVVDRCRAAGSVEIAGVHRALDDVVATLSAWDGTLGLDSVGGVLWREIIASFPDGSWTDAGPLFAVGFDPDAPLDTPHSLAAAPDQGIDPVVAAVGHALAALDHAGVAVDAPLRDVQWAVRGERRIPVHGGGEAEGLLNVLAPVGALSTTSLEPAPPVGVRVPGRDRTGLHDGGYQVTYGTSFLMAVELTETGPSGVGLLAYGQSGDPRSPHHADGTEAYASCTTRPLLFDDASIEADPNLQRRTLRWVAT